LKVIHVLNHFLPQQIAGTEVYVWSLTKQLQKHNIDVEVIIPNHQQKESSFYFHDNIKVIKYAEPSVVDRSLIMDRRKPEGLKNFVTYLIQNKPNIVNFHELSGSNGITLHHVIAAKKYGAKVIMTFHLASNSCKTGTLMYLGKELCDGKIDVSRCSKCYLSTKSVSRFNNAALILSDLFHKFKINTTLWNNKLGTALGIHKLITDFNTNFKTLIANCDKVITLNDWYKNILISNGVPDHKIEIIKQGFVYNSISNSNADTNKIDKRLHLIFLGRISAFKGLHLLIAAIKKVPDHLLTLHIYGQTTDLNYEEKLKQETANHTNIHWMGKLNPQDVLITMKKYDALCLCSTFSEMSPLVIQEAFAAGIPVIASNVYGNAEQVKHETNGLLFEFNNVESLAFQITRLLKV